MGPPKQQILGVLSFPDQVPAILGSSKKENRMAAQPYPLPLCPASPQQTWVSTQWPCLYPLGEPGLIVSGAIKSLSGVFEPGTGQIPGQMLFRMG